uniref:Uncharacterized protein n=1 Tax=Rhodococcus sp. NS1 TaxID=402236 RepID=A0A097SPX8_9NOCA|nr:hypothetical protein LRS1606.146 [Rhodococcus sp. NS1]
MTADPCKQAAHAKPWYAGYRGHASPPESGLAGHREYLGRFRVSCLVVGRPRHKQPSIHFALFGQVGRGLGHVSRGRGRLWCMT